MVEVDLWRKMAGAARGCGAARAQSLGGSSFVLSLSCFPVSAAPVPSPCPFLPGWHSLYLSLFLFLSLLALRPFVPSSPS